MSTYTVYIYSGIPLQLTTPAEKKSVNYNGSQLYRESRPSVRTYVRTIFCQLYRERPHSVLSTITGAASQKKGRTDGWTDWTDYKKSNGSQLYISVNYNGIALYIQYTIIILSILAIGPEKRKRCVLLTKKTRQQKYTLIFCIPYAKCRCFFFY